jgi:hypothetical protein
MAAPRALPVAQRREISLHVLLIGPLLLACAVVFAVAVALSGRPGGAGPVAILAFAGFGTVGTGAVVALLEARKLEGRAERWCTIGSFLVLIAAGATVVLRYLATLWLGGPGSLPPKGSSFSGYTELSYRVVVVAGAEIALGALLAVGIYLVAASKFPGLHLVHPQWFVVGGIILLVIVYLGQALILAQSAPALDDHARYGRSPKLVEELAKVLMAMLYLSLILPVYHCFLGFLAHRAIIKR